MGSNSSSQSRYMTQQERTRLAVRKFHIRKNGYDYALHGSYRDYIYWCHAQYELDCIPEECRYGNNYKPNNGRGYDDYITPTCD